MNIESTIEELKKKSALINGVNIDFQYIQQLTPQVLNYTGEHTQEYKNLCVTLRSLCSKVEEGIGEIKLLIPNPSN